MARLSSKWLLFHRGCGTHGTPLNVRLRGCETGGTPEIDEIVAMHPQFQRLLQVLEYELERALLVVRDLMQLDKRPQHFNDRRIHNEVMPQDLTTTEHAPNKRCLRAGGVGNWPQAFVRHCDRNTSNIERAKQQICFPPLLAVHTIKLPKTKSVWPLRHEGEWPACVTQWREKEIATPVHCVKLCLRCRVDAPPMQMGQVVIRLATLQGEYGAHAVRSILHSSVRRQANHCILHSKVLVKGKVRLQAVHAATDVKFFTGHRWSRWRRLQADRLGFHGKQYRLGFNDGQIQRR